MKIKYEKTEKTTLFCGLEPCDVFSMTLDGVPFMKLKASFQDEYNAVNLIVGCLCKVKEDAQIIPIDCELVIK